VGPRAGLDAEDRGKILSALPRIEPRSPGRPARSQTLYCLSYPGSYTASVLIYNRILIVSSLIKHSCYWRQDNLHKCWTEFRTNCKLISL
jgi:hypothetical protein